MIVTDKKESEDDIKVAGGWISLSDFNKMKKEQNSRFNATMRRQKIQRVIEKIFDTKQFFRIFASMRDRAYRRYMEERKVINRLNNIRGYWYRFTDANGLYTVAPTLADFIGTENAFRYKTHTTTKWDSKYKDKYSPNKNRSWRNKGQLRTREENKLLLSNILKEYGIK